MKENENYNIKEDVWSTWIGRDVAKHSGKPFKSTRKIGKPIDMCMNPFSNKMAFKFEDGTLVDCGCCYLVIV